MLDARGNPPFVLPHVVVNVQPLTEEELHVWHTPFERYAAIPGGWALVGGQMGHLHCWQRGIEPPRVTTDAHLIMDIRADRQSLTRVSDFLAGLGYEEDGRSPANIGHRWIRNRDGRSHGARTRRDSSARADDHQGGQQAEYVAGSRCTRHGDCIV
jgi:hypothetical protein